MKEIAVANCKVSFTQNKPRVDKISDKSQTTPVLPPPPLVIGAEETHTQHTIADSRTRHVIIVGHIARVCRSKLQGKPKQTPKTPPQNAQVHTVEYSETDEYEDLLSLNKSHNRTERDSQGVARDILISKKLFLELCGPCENSFRLPSWLPMN